MKRTDRFYLVVLAASLVLFTVLPLIASTRFFADFSLVFLLAALIIINPLFFAATGWMTGLMNGAKWLVPIVCDAVFFVSAYFIYGMNEWFYAAEYIVLAYGGILARILLQRLKPKGSKSDTTGREC